VNPWINTLVFSLTRTLMLQLEVNEIEEVKDPSGLLLPPLLPKFVNHEA